MAEEGDTDCPFRAPPGDPYGFGKLISSPNPEQAVPQTLKNLQDLLGYALGLTMASLECDHTSTIWEVSEASGAIKTIICALCSSTLKLSKWKSALENIELRLGYGRVVAVILTGFRCSELNCFFPYVGFGNGTDEWFRPWAGSDSDDLCRAAVYFCTHIMGMGLAELYQCSPSISPCFHARLRRVFVAAEGEDAPLPNGDFEGADTIQTRAQVAIETARTGFFNAVETLQSVEDSSAAEALHVTLSTAANVLSACTNFVLFGEAYLLPGVDLVVGDIMHCIDVIVQYAMLLKDSRVEEGQMEAAAERLKGFLVLILDGLEKYFGTLKKLHTNLHSAMDKAPALRKAKIAVAVLKHIGDTLPQAHSVENEANPVADLSVQEVSMRNEILRLINEAHDRKCEIPEGYESIFGHDLGSTGSDVLGVDRSLKRKVEDMAAEDNAKSLLGDSVVSADLLSDADLQLWDVKGPSPGPWLGTECLLGDALSEAQPANGDETVFGNLKSSRDYVEYQLGAMKARLTNFVDVVSAYLSHYELNNFAASPVFVTESLARSIDAHRAAIMGYHCPMCMWQAVFVSPDMTQQYNPSPYSLSRLNG